MTKLVSRRSKRFETKNDLQLRGGDSISCINHSTRGLRFEADLKELSDADKRIDSSREELAAGKVWVHRVPVQADDQRHGKICDQFRLTFLTVLTLWDLNLLVLKMYIYDQRCVLWPWSLELW